MILSSDWERLGPGTWEGSDNKVPLVRMSQDDPLNPSSTKNYQVDSENNNQGESNMIKEKFIKTHNF